MPPRTLYIRRPVVNWRTLAAWFQDQGLHGIENPDSMHVTIAHSAKPVDWGRIPGPNPQEGFTVVGGPRTLEVLGKPDGPKHLVQRFESQVLDSRWKEVCAAGASWDFPSYLPHVTLIPDFVPGLIQTIPYFGTIVLGREQWEEVV